jgi:hypothetical protein
VDAQWELIGMPSHQRHAVLGRRLLGLVVFGRGILYALLERIKVLLVFAPHIGDERAVLIEKVLGQESVAYLLRIRHQFLPHYLELLLIELISVSINPIEVLSAHKNRQVVHVSQFIRCNEPK